MPIGTSPGATLKITVPAGGAPASKPSTPSKPKARGGAAYSSAKGGGPSDPKGVRIDIDGDGIPDATAYDTTGDGAPL